MEKKQFSNLGFNLVLMMLNLGITVAVYLIIEESAYFTGKVAM